MGSIAYYGVNDAGPERSLHILVSNYDNKSKRSHKEENTEVASGLSECIIHSLTDDLWEDTDAPSDVNAVPIYNESEYSEAQTDCRGKVKTTKKDSFKRN